MIVVIYVNIDPSCHFAANMFSTANISKTSLTRGLKFFAKNQETNNLQKNKRKNFEIAFLQRMLAVPVPAAM